MTEKKSTTVGWTVAAAGFGFALVQLDVTIVNVALPDIAKALGTDVAGLQWVIDAYALTFAAFLLTAGFLGDRLGARKIYLIGFGIFAVASLACGLAANALVLIAARVIQGLGAAAMLPCSLALINHATGHDKALRAKAVGWWTAAGSIAIAAGPIIGGLLIGAASWRSIFLVNMPVVVAGALLTFRVEETAVKTGSNSFDLPGQILGVVALAAITGAVIEAKPLGFASPTVLGLAIAGLIAAIVFIRVEAKSPSPMLPLSLFRNASFSWAVVYGVVVNLTYYGIVFVLSLYLQRVLGYSAIRAGVAYLPLTATFFAANIVSGWWVGKWGSRGPMIVGALIDAIGFALLLLLVANSSYWLMLPAFALMPTGMGLGVPAMTTAVLASVESEVSGIASGVLNAARQAGGAIGVALFGSFAGDGAEHVVSGLHMSALTSIAMLGAAAVIAMFGIDANAAGKKRR
jgi:DHA2 family methylenomycin A resistance protein-like MFS transporter